MLVLIILTLHLLVMICFWSPVSVGPDTNGYYIQTRLLGDEGRLWTKHEKLFQYVSQHWLIVNDDTLISRYPPGIAFLQVIPYWLVGTGFTLLNPIMTTLTLLGVFLMSKRFTGDKWALLALCITAVNPILNSWAFEGDAHPAVVFFLIWGMYAILCWSKKTKWLLLIPIALWMGMIPTFRYPEAVFIPSFSLFIWAHQRWSIRGFLQGILFGITGLLPLLLVYIYNQSMFGSFGETGYGTGEQLFSIWHFLFKVVPYLVMIIGYGVTGFAILGMMGLYWLLKRVETRSVGILFCGIIIPLTVIYMSYFFFDATMRFLTPTYPLYIIVGVWYLQHLHTTYSKRMFKWTPRIIVLTLVVCSIESGFAVAVKVSSHSEIIRITKEFLELVPKDSVLIASDVIQNQMDFIGGWKLVDEDILLNREDRHPGMPGGPPGREENGSHHRPPGPMFGMDMELMSELMQHEQQAYIREYYTSERTGVLSQHAIDDLKTWSGKQKKFYWLGDTQQVRNLLSDEFSIELLEELEVPRMQYFGPPPLRPHRQRGDIRNQTKHTLMKITW